MRKSLPGFFSENQALLTEEKQKIYSGNTDIENLKIVNQSPEEISESLGISWSSRLERIKDLLKCCYSNQNNNQQTEALIKKSQHSFLSLKLFKKLFSNPKIKEFIEKYIKPGYEGLEVQLLAALTFDALCVEIMEALEYHGKPTEDQIANARMLAQGIAVCIVTISNLRKIFKDAELEGSLYHAINVASEFTFTLIVVLYIDSLRQPGEMPNDTKTLSELFGLCSIALGIGLMSYKDFRDKLYTVISNRFNININTNIKKIINGIFEGVSAASTAGFGVEILQEFTHMIYPDKAYLNPYSPPMNYVRWSAMFAYAGYRFSVEVRNSSEEKLENIAKLESIMLILASLFYEGTIFYWLNQIDTQDHETPYEYAFWSALGFMLMTQLAIISYKSYSATSTQENNNETRIEEITDAYQSDKKTLEGKENNIKSHSPDRLFALEEENVENKEEDTTVIFKY